MSVTGRIYENDPLKLYITIEDDIRTINDQKIVLRFPNGEQTTYDATLESGATETSGQISYEIPADILYEGKQYRAWCLIQYNVGEAYRTSGSADDADLIFDVYPAGNKKV